MARSRSLTDGLRIVWVRRCTVCGTADLTGLWPRADLVVGARWWRCDHCGSACCEPAPTWFPT